MKNILNYQGNKRSLLDFISKESGDFIVPNKYFLDIFAGSGSVSLHFADKYKVAFNDLEKYSYHIISAHLQSNESQCTLLNLQNILTSYNSNRTILYNGLSKHLSLEQSFINTGDVQIFDQIIKNYPSIWNGSYSELLNGKVSIEKLDESKNRFYALFTFYYANSYFGIKQCIDIDSIRFAIDSQPDQIKSLLFTALYYAMNACVFSKDGHMAQPLNPTKYLTRCLRLRQISIIDTFVDFLETFKPISNAREHIGFSQDFATLIENPQLMKNVGCIYADPPYTDMQYSRYYHLLNTVTDYRYVAPTIQNGKYTKGLYLDNRIQSDLSCKSSCLTQMRKLINECKNYGINLIISFAYPCDPSSQKTDRYVMDINDLIESCNESFGKNRVFVKTNAYLHSNHRNSEKKSVFEYLILCKGAIE